MVKDTFTHTIKLIRDRFDVQHVMSTTNIAIATNVHMQIFYAWCLGAKRVQIWTLL